MTAKKPAPRDDFDEIGHPDDPPPESVEVTTEADIRAEQAEQSAHALRHIVNSTHYEALGVQGAVNVADHQTGAFREHVAALAEIVAFLAKVIAAQK